MKQFFAETSVDCGTCSIDWDYTIRFTDIERYSYDTKRVFLARRRLDSRKCSAAVCSKYLGAANWTD